MRRTLPGAVLALVLAAPAIHASDRVAVYAKIDRVVFEPGAETPERVQVWGIFSVADRRNNNPNDYLPAARGYLYFALPANAELARREWKDLQSVAGKGDVVAFGSRWEGTPRVRSSDEKPQSPEPYALNTGVVNVRGRGDYAPVRALTASAPR